MIINAKNVEAVHTHTHTHTQGNLINVVKSDVCIVSIKYTYQYIDDG